LTTDDRRIIRECTEDKIQYIYGLLGMDVGCITGIEPMIQRNILKGIGSKWELDCLMYASRVTVMR
jgi:hypothetical protein